MAPPKHVTLCTGGEDAVKGLEVKVSVQTSRWTQNIIIITWFSGTGHSTKKGPSNLTQGPLLCYNGRRFTPLIDLVN